MSTINLASVLQLPVEDRIRLVEAIWDSVASEPEHVVLEPWQAAELDRRLASFEIDPGEGLHWDEVKRRILGTP